MVAPRQIGTANTPVKEYITTNHRLFGKRPKVGIAIKAALAKMFQHE